MFRVLIVDDHDDSRAIMARLLKGEGHEVETAGTVEAAIKAAAHFNPEILIADWLLPDGTGVQATEGIRKIHPDVRVMLISGLPLAHLEGAIGQMKPDYFLMKPFDFADVRAAMQCIAA